MLRSASLLCVLVLSVACVSPASVAPTPLPTSPPPGTSQANPAPLGVSIPVKETGPEYELAIVEILSGRDAAARLVQRSVNVGPDVGHEWMLIRMTGKRTDTTGEPSYFGCTDYWTIYAQGKGINQVRGAGIGPSAPEPELCAAYLPGAELDGWVLLETDPTDPGPLLHIPDRVSLMDPQDAWFLLSDELSKDAKGGPPEG